MTKSTCSIEGCEKPRKTRGMCGMHAERVRRYGDPSATAFVKTDDLIERFWSRVDRREDGECWRWTGAHAQGYGLIPVGGRRLPAHRFAYELLVGPIPAGLTIDHVWARGCKHRDCVNPAHLEPVTNVENIMRGNAYSAVNARKTHCIRGHEFDRLIVRADGRVRRRCTTCHRMKTAEAAARRKARAT